MEVNESFITGEEKTIYKKSGDTILSGSFIISGTCYVKVISVGKDNYVSKITNEAKYIKKTNSVIYNSFDQMLKILGFLLVFIGIFNAFNVRSQRLNILGNITKNKVFLIIIGFIFIV